MPNEPIIQRNLSNYVNSLLDGCLLFHIIQRVLQREVNVASNPRTYKALRNELAGVLEELRRIETGESVDSELLELISQINDTLYGLKR